MAKTDFQTQVATTPAVGVPGDKASLNPFVYTDRNFVAGDATVTVGNFVWDDPDNPATNASYHGSGIFKALSTGEAGTLPLGIVQRNLSYVNYDILDSGTLVVPELAPLQTVLFGDMYAIATTAATKGQKVFAVFADGSLKTGAAGATIAGAIETNWLVTEGGATGEIITVSSWRS